MHLHMSIFCCTFVADFEKQKNNIPYKNTQHNESTRHYAAVSCETSG